MPGGGKIVILWMLAIVVSACATAPTGSNSYRPAFPARPTLEVMPKLGACKLATGAQGECVMFWGPDWQQIRVYQLTLERELTAACLALGGSQGECGAE